MQFHEKSYEKHANSYDSEKHALELELHKKWYESNTVNLWRHLRMLKVLDPFLEEYKNAKWLTVGDGRFGTSAMYISKKGGNVMASDIDDKLLILARDSGLLENISKENAESLSFENEQFDYAFCKEAYHHFPRPYLAVYEMLRCTKEAIIFTEPNDWIPSPIPRRIIQILKNKIKTLLGKKIPHTDDGNYEPSGNYIYSISEREFQKIALGLSLPMVAYYNFHDVYIKGAANESLTENGPILKRTKKAILINEILCFLGLSTKNRISAIIFKKMPSDSLIAKLNNNGFKTIQLPKNPYL